MNTETETNLERLLEHREWLTAVARQMVGDGAADDVAQETLLSAVKSPPPASRPTRGWLRTVAKNVVRMRHRSSVRRERREGLVPTAEIDGDSFVSVHKSQASRLLAEAIDRLSPPLRDAVILRYFEELSLAEIAARQGVPMGTAGRRVHDGLKQLRVDLDQNEQGDARPWLMALVPGFDSSGVQTTAPAVPNTGGSILSKIAIAFVFAFVLGAGGLAIYHSTADAGDGQPAAAAPLATSSPKTDTGRWPSATAEPVARLEGRAPTKKSGAETTPEFSPYDFSSSFMVENRDRLGKDYGVVMNQVTGQLGEMGPVVESCFEEHFRHHPDQRKTPNRAAIKLSYANDPAHGGIVVDSQYLANASTIDTPGMGECMRHSGYAWELGEPLATDVDLVQMTISIRYDPTPRGKNLIAKQRACFDHYRNRHPEFDPDAAASFEPDRELESCLATTNQLGGPPKPIERPFSESPTEDQTAKVETCAKAFMLRTARTPEDHTVDAELDTCLREAGIETAVKIGEALWQP